MHEKMETLADLYAAGGLNPDERREADAHAAQCAACASMLRAATDFRGWVTGALAPDAPPADLEERIVARLRASSALKSKRWRFLSGRRLLKFLGGIAAAVGMVVLGSAFPTGGSARTLVSSLSDAAESHQRDYSVYPPAGYNTLPHVSVQRNPGVTGAIWGFDSSASMYDRDLSQVKQYNSALERDNAEMRSKTGGGDHFYRAWSEEATADPSTRDSGGVPRSIAKSLAGLEAERVENYPSTPESGKAHPKTAEKLDKLGAVEPDKPASHPKHPEALAQTMANPEQPRPPQPQDNRKIIRTADVDLEVDSYDGAQTRLAAMVTEEKGFVATASTQRMPNGKIRATVTVRVPPERFDALIAKLRDLGTVRSQNVGSQEITKAYLDLETRRGSKEALLERLKLLLQQAKGTVKELLEVEVQMGKTIEEIESIKGELKYFDNQVSLSTITLTISEKDLGQPFEYVQTLQSNIGLTARNADDAYAKAQNEIAGAGGQVVDSKMNRESDGRATGTIKARVDAEKFPALREALKRLGHVTTDTVNQQKTARGGAEGTPKPDAPLKKEQAVIDLTITTPPVVFTRSAGILVESDTVQETYAAARKTIEATGAKIVGGSLTGQPGGTRASIVAELDADRFQALVDALRATGKVKDSAVKLDLPAASPDGAAPLLRERARIEYILVSPPRLIGEEHGIGKTIKDTFAGSWKGVLWSLEKLFVGLSLAGPWIGLAFVGWLGWRRFRRKKPAAG